MTKQCIKILMESDSANESALPWHDALSIGERGRPKAGGWICLEAAGAEESSLSWRMLGFSKSWDKQLFYLFIVVMQLAIVSFYTYF